MPSWREHYRSSDQTRHYRYLYRVLQALQHARGGQRWVLKSPQHLEQLGPLSTVFPDATHVLTHRDPGEVTVSMVTMIVYAARMHLDRVDPIAISGYWQDLLADLLTACVRDRDLLRARSVDGRAVRRLHVRRARRRRRRRTHWPTSRSTTQWLRPIATTWRPTPATDTAR